MCFSIRRFLFNENVDDLLDLELLVEDDVQEWHKVENERCVDGSQSLVQNSLDLVDARSILERELRTLSGNFESTVVSHDFVQDARGVSTNGLSVVDGRQLDEEGYSKIGPHGQVDVRLREEDCHVDELKDEAK